MVTVNKKLEALTLDDINRISHEYMMGWHDLMKPYGFMIKGLNKKRSEYDMPKLTKAISLEYRLNYVRKHFSDTDVEITISDYIRNARMDGQRWQGVDLFDCRFNGKEYVPAFKALLGATRYKEISEAARVAKMEESQIDLYGGVGLAGKSTREHAQQTNLRRHGGRNVMDDQDVRDRLAVTNTEKYGGLSPFSSVDVKAKVFRIRHSDVADELDRMKAAGKVRQDVVVDSVQELRMLKLLCHQFSVDDVYTQYGPTQADDRYPFHCDFYIKSIDLFIELNAYYSHGKHWFDPKSSDDQALADKWRSTGSRLNLEAADVWTMRDPKKRQAAKANRLRYLVFWDNDNALSDVVEWLTRYHGDFESFVNDHPENTY